MKLTQLLLSLALMQLSPLYAAQTSDGEKPIPVNQLPTEKCTPTNSAGDYPFDLQQVESAVTHARKHWNRFGAMVHVVVVDNGFVGYEVSGVKYRGSQNYPQAFFHYRPPVDFQPFQPVMDLAPAPIDLVRGHGTHVTGVILGGAGHLSDGRTGNGLGVEVRRLFLDDQGAASATPAAVNSWLQLYVVGLSATSGDLSGDQLQYLASKIKALPSEMRKPDIMNISLLYTPNSDNVPTEIRELPEYFKDTLLIVSSGNQGVRLHEDGQGQYPAMAKAGDNLIVVASHDADMTRSAFSNYHPERATIAAPGCGILSWTSGSGPAVPGSGTSQSAALVTFAAALLKSHFRGATIADLKERLIVASRYSEPLAKGCPPKGKPIGACVPFGAALDVAMTLYYDSDVVEYCVDGATVAIGCKTRFAVGTLKSLPGPLQDCIAETARVEAEDVYATGLSRPGAIRRTGIKRFEAIVRQKESPYTLVPACDMELTQGSVALVPEDQTAAIQIPIAQIMRVVTRSTPRAD